MRRELLKARGDWEVQAFTGLHKAYGSGSNTLDAIWRTIVGNQLPGGRLPDGLRYGTCFQRRKDAVAGEETNFTDPELSQLGGQTVLFCQHRALCVTESGRVGVAPSTSQKGDAVCVFPDGTAPFILRA
jgi:hypothetical protein